MDNLRQRLLSALSNKFIFDPATGKAFPSGAMHTMGDLGTAAQQYTTGATSKGQFIDSAVNAAPMIGGMTEAPSPKGKFEVTFLRDGKTIPHSVHESYAQARKSADMIPRGDGGFISIRDITPALDAMKKRIGK